MTIRKNSLRFHNSLTRSLESFESLVPGHVGIYVCGPTVYGDAHLGHAKSYVAFDVLVKYLRHLGYRVRYVQNITDVGHLTDDADEGDDKLEQQARLDRVHPMELAERYTASYLRDMDALKVARADIYPRATQHIPEQISLARRLLETGHAYEKDGNVYFSVESWPDYGKLSGRQIDESRAGHRVSVRSDKRDPRDFALWKAAEGGHILRWESPWGWGYPGWHLECSAMSTKYLGEAFDIHGGGIENQFPHHECEVAQSRAVGHPFARFWLHNNMINVDGQKMGKSLGNFVTLEDALKAHTPETIRYFLLATHYRSPANYTADALSAAGAGLERLGTCVSLLRAGALEGPDDPEPADTDLHAAVVEADRAFHAAMDEDLNTPEAIAALFELVHRVNVLAPRGLSAAVQREALAVLEDLGEGVLGIVGAARESAAGDAGPFIDLLLGIRSDLKSRKEFELADRIRDDLTAHGIEVKDTREGATWKRRG